MSGLNLTVESLDSVPEGLRSFYKESGDDGGGFVLDLADPTYAGLRDKVKEFRTSAIDKGKAADAAAEKLKGFDGIDPVKAREAMELAKHLEGVEEARLIKEGKWDEVLGKRTEKMKATHDKALAAAHKERDDAVTARQELFTELQKHLVDAAVIDAIDEVGVLRKGARKDALNRARALFALNDDREIVAGEDVFNKDGSPMTPADFAAELLSSAGYLFESSKGAGGKGGPAKTDSGKIMVSRSDAKAMAKYSKEIREGKVVFTD